MELSQHLDLKQTLTPQQILLSTLLQLPSMALELRIKTELEINPLLELVEDIIELDNPEEEGETEEPEIDLEDFFPTMVTKRKSTTTKVQKSLKFRMHILPVWLKIF